MFGDDGVSRYPNEMVIGQPVTDQGGTQYSLPAGVFRFPLVAPGNYRLEVLPPGNYNFPSQRTVADLQTLPNAPFRLQPGSFGQNFVVSARAGGGRGRAARRQQRCCVLRKTAGQQIATTGDFVQYTLTLENTSEDGRLHRGGRGRPAARRRAIPRRFAASQWHAHRRSRAGRRRQLRSPTCTRNWPPGSRITLRYVVEFTIAMRGMKDAINTAQAIAPGNVRSNEARALVRMNEELFSQKGFIVGRVFEGTCESDGREDFGVANVRVYLEDGRYGITDENGHFHFEGLEPGTHTVQLDKFTLPEYLELAPCADRMGHAGRDYSQFAELRPGTLWRSDFVLRQKAAPQRRRAIRIPFGAVAPEADGDDVVLHEAVVRVNGVPTGNTRVVVMLPDRFEYVPGSATVDGARATDSKDQVIGAGDPVSSVADGVITRAARRARAGHRAHGALRHARRPARGGTLPVRALAVFDSPAKSGLRTQPVESQLSRGAARFGRSQFTFSPRFDVLKTELSPADEEALHDLIRSWRGARDITIRAVGSCRFAADRRPQSRGVRRQLRAVACPRAGGGRLPRHFAGRSGGARARRRPRVRRADVEPGNDAASHAANRRVEIVIEGSRFEANAPLELTAAGGKARNHRARRV